MRHILSKIAAGIGILACTALPLTASAGAIAVYVGYADSVRASPDYPTPFAAGANFGGATVDNFFANLSGTPDTGAVLIVNTASTDITVSGLKVSRNGFGNNLYNLWNGTGPGQFNGSFILAAGKAAIFAENSGNNFDSSDTSSAAFAGATETGTTFNADTNNCSVGAIAASTACTSSAYVVSFVLDSVSTDFFDSAHVLDTGGFDSALYIHAHSNGITSTNESLQWRAIGTSGINDPGGTTPGNVPEPGTIALVGVALAGAELARRRRS
jgi:hypothetical protein